MNILFAAATPFEIQPLLSHLKKKFVPSGHFTFQKGETEVSVLITGAGLPMMAYSMGKILAGKEVHLAINAGIGGAFTRKFNIGDVVQVVSERFGDLGVQEADGRFTDVCELGLIEADEPPFRNGQLVNEAAGQFSFLPAAHGLSVNKVHGHPPDIEAIRAKYPDAEIESMEGAAFFYACRSEGIPFLEIRSVSNYVEARNRENWDIPLAIEKLNEVLVELVGSFFG
ncbi:MAG: futalosine hydrolase [Lewinellaceae bacterium]|nr:futalosine hydrolase [Phaeodactylibacter sp.]MCB9349273.1 futalosine hydrolase [Lewinellaceae bacterium]